MRRAATVFVSLFLGALLAAPAAAAEPEQPPTHLIQISLLVAARQGPSELADLPANTREAIEDVRRFLPFKSYRLLDTALLRAQRGARTTLTGPGQRAFHVALSLDGTQPPGKLLVLRFELIEQVAPAVPAVPAAGGGDGDGRAAAPPAPASKLLMSSSFAADAGQTVVVGTSRLNGGDEALIVLFTALP